MQRCVTWLATSCTGCVLYKVLAEGLTGSTRRQLCGQIRIIIIIIIRAVLVGGIEGCKCAWRETGCGVSCVGVQQQIGLLFNVFRNIVLIPPHSPIPGEDPGNLGNTSADDLLLSACMLCRPLGTPLGTSTVCLLFCAVRAFSNHSTMLDTI